MDLGPAGDFGGMAGFFGGVLGIFAIFFLAIFYAVFGSLMTALFAGIYNLMARGFGGVELQLETQLPASPSPPAMPAEME